MVDKTWTEREEETVASINDTGNTSPFTDAYYDARFIDDGDRVAWKRCADQAFRHRVYG